MFNANKGNILEQYEILLFEGGLLTYLPSKHIR